MDGEKAQRITREARVGWRKLWVRHPSVVDGIVVLRAAKEYYVSCSLPLLPKHPTNYCREFVFIEATAGMGAEIAVTPSPLVVRLIAGYAESTNEEVHNLTWILYCSFFVGGGMEC